VYVAGGAASVCVGDDGAPLMIFDGIKWRIGAGLWGYSVGCVS